MPANDTASADTASADGPADHGRAVDGAAADESPYASLPLEGPLQVAVGHALITMVEPAPGQDRAYNRWYEDDHFFAGGLLMPWLFAGRRWVATRALREMRYPADSPVARPLSAGCFLTTYWIAPGRLADHQAWSSATNRRLGAEGRVFEQRDHVFTSFQDHVGTVYRDRSVVPDVYALMDPAPGLVVEVVDAPEPDARGALERWLVTEHLPQRVGPGSSALSAMVFRTNGPDPGMGDQWAARLRETANGGRRVTVLWFLDRDPREVWADTFAGEGGRVAAGGLGTAVLLAPFIPSRMGTDAYLDELR